MKVMVIGGPGNISTSALQDLVDRGEIVGLFSRPSGKFGEVDPRVQILPGDRDVEGQLERAFSDFAPDVVLDFACFVPPQAARSVKMAYGKVSHYIFASTVDVYSYPLMRLPFRESDPWRPQTISVYAENKRQCEAIFREAAHPRLFPLTITRPSYSFGGRFVLSALDRAGGPSFIYRLQHGLPILIPGDGTTLIHASSGFNAGRMTTALIHLPAAIDNDYTLAHPEAMEYEQYIRLFAGALGVEPNLVFIPTEVILSVRDPAMDGNLLAELLRYNIQFSIEKFQRDVPDFVFELLLPAAKRAVDWILASERVTDAEIIDDRIIRAYQHALTHFTANAQD